MLLLKSRRRVRSMVRCAQCAHVPPLIHFHCARGFRHPNTRIHVRLLGPCFKTGRLKPFSQHPTPRGGRPQSSAVHDRGTINRHAEACPTFPTALCTVCSRTDVGRRAEACAIAVSSVSLLTISRTVSLSLQSSFHLSLTVLVRYRSLAVI